jgi:hypothetical protein
MVKHEADITIFTNAEDGKNSIEYEISPDRSKVRVTIYGPGMVSYTLPQIAGARRLDDPVFVRFANSFGITPQLLQSVVITEYLRIVSQP